MTTSAQSTTTARSVMSGRVRFEFVNSHAKSVCVAGSFNGWDPSATRMVPAGHGRWLSEVWLPQGIHQYLLVIDGEWVFDLNATDYVPNVFGGMNAIVEVSSELKPSRAGASPQPACAPKRMAKEGERTTSRGSCCV